MTQYVDLHCHFIPGVDDGARTFEDAVAMLTGLEGLGFDHVIATPHIRPGLFDNGAGNLREAYASLLTSFGQREDLPRTELSAEHYFDDVVFRRIMADEVLPYPAAGAILLEFYDSEFPLSIDHRLADICRKGLIPVIAHPERYRPIEKHPEILERLLDLGAVALLDVAALVGKYGRRAAKTSEMLLERGLYGAACSDAHSPKDLPQVAAGMEWLARHYGDDEVLELFSVGPRDLLKLTGQSRP